MGIKYAVNEEFFRNWNHEMAYVLGYLYADGSMEDASYLRGKYIRVSSIDRQTILKIKRLMNSKHTIVTRIPSSQKRGTSYLLRIGSHKLYNDLTDLGLFPHKSLTIKFPKVPVKYLKDFVRGYLDGDGCVYLERAQGKKQKLIVKRLRVIFTSGSKIFLEGLHMALHENFAVQYGKIYDSHRSFQLQYPTSSSIELFRLLYKNVSSRMYLERKLKVFIKYFALRPSVIDKDIAYIIKCVR